MNDFCPICQSPTIKEANDDLRFYRMCSKYTQSEYFESAIQFTIADDFYFIRHNKITNESKFSDTRCTSPFSIKGKFKIINHSVAETYSYYKKLAIFS